MPRVYLSLGSNCRREASLAAALRLLRESFGAVACSPVYESDAEGLRELPILTWQRRWKPLCRCLSCGRSCATWSGRWAGNAGARSAD